MAEYTLKPEDANKTLEVNDENPNNTVKIIVPEHSNSPIPIGTEIKVYRGNEAKAEFEPQNNVEIVSAIKEFFTPTFFIRKYGEAQIRKRALNQWVLKGDLIYFNIFAEGGDEVFIIEQNGQLYRVHTFTTVGESEFDVISGSDGVDVFLVGGGGSGGGERGGGGGGFAKSYFNIFLQEGSYQVTVGAGGIHPGTPRSNAPGEDSFFIDSEFIAEGGQVAGNNGGSGGSGGGGSATSGARFGGNGGSDGGDGDPGSEGGGGSGQGFSTREFNQIFQNGFWQTINSNSTATLYAGGGGGGGDGGSPGFGGDGGGGNGVQTGLATDGVPNTGGGGGSTSSSGGSGSGDGGSGIVIVRYPIRQAED